MTDRSIYVGRASGNCPSLARAGVHDVVTFEMQGGELCTGDRFSVGDPAQTGVTQCRLGSLERR